MAFHACNPAAANCNDPKNHMVYVAQSDDGAGWSPVPGYQAYSGSVPDLVRRGNVLYVYSPGIVRRYRIDTDQWEDPVPVRLMGSDGGPEEFVDPSAWVDEEGRIVLFYMVGMRGGDPAQCAQGQTTCTKIFRSATEVEGGDGADFVVDEGNRVEIQISSQPMGSENFWLSTASDPDIFKGPDGYVLYISRGNSVQVFASDELRGSYQMASSLPNGLLSSNSGGIASGYYDAGSGKYWTYVHSNEGGSTTVIRRAVHSSFSSPLTQGQFSTIISGSSFPGLGSAYRVESPGFAVNEP
ncbi:MAG: hypothetical protein Q7T16_06770 [Candidatus Burarchaeum sp.]|nr:hypothetical protein [Candidatus Burarchaeum sp.]MDO8340331.1 hypothetical protein [Candidatus Burarchaeum sp.]